MTIIIDKKDIETFKFSLSKGLTLFVLSIILVNILHIKFNIHKTLSVQERYTQLDKSVVTIITEYKIVEKDKTTKFYGQGTGTYIEPHFILTAAHVVDDIKTVDIHIKDKTYKGYVVSTSVTLDTAIIYTPEYKGTPIQLGNSDIVEPGDSILTVGTPVGLTDTLGIGYIAAPIRKNTKGLPEVLQYTANNFHGNSGGGLFNSNDELIGVIDSVLVYEGTEVITQNFAMTINSLKPFIKRSIANYKRPKDK